MSRYTVRPADRRFRDICLGVVIGIVLALGIFWVLVLL